MPFPLNITQNGYAVLFVIVLAEALGLPVPAALALLIAGGSSAKGPLHLGVVLLTSVSALLLGDSLLFLLGPLHRMVAARHFMQAFAESGLMHSALGQLVSRHGRTLLVLAKFVPGINSLAPPLAGSMNMRFAQFFPFDVGGALLYAVVWVGTGFLFSDFIASLTNGYKVGSRILPWVLAFAIAGYFGYKIFRLLQAGPLSYVPRVSASEVARRFYSDLHNDLAVFDVRSHGYYSEKASRIKGSIRLEPNTILEQIDSLPKDKELILYCTCLREATSLRVARILHQHGFRASVIKGGLRAWKRGGYALETVPAEDIVLLPTF